MNDFLNSEILQWDLTARSAFRLGIVVLVLLAYWKTRARVPTALAGLGAMVGYWIATNQGWFQERITGSPDLRISMTLARREIGRWSDARCRNNALPGQDSVMLAVETVGR